MSETVSSGFRRGRNRPAAHCGVGLHFAPGVPSSHDPPAVHHGDAVGQAERDVHVVLDHDQRDLARQRARPCCENALPLARRQARRRARRAAAPSDASAERERQLELAPLAVGQELHRFIGAIAQAHRRQVPRAPASRTAGNASTGRFMIHLRRSVPTIASTRFSRSVRSVNTLVI